MKEHHHIELRTEQSRRFLKAKPPFFIRWGTTIIAFIVVTAILIYLSYKFL